MSVDPFDFRALMLKRYPVPCPTCGAVIGQRCFSATGNKQVDAHTARITLRDDDGVNV